VTVCSKSARASIGESRFPNEVDVAGGSAGLFDGAPRPPFLRRSTANDVKEMFSMLLRLVGGCRAVGAIAGFLRAREGTNCSA
jgi:hypothetical protein